jgi:ABA sandwich protein
MKPEDIENMQAGREMDLLIIKAVFGLETQECMVGGHPRGCTGNVSYPKYSTDIAAAWLVVEKMRDFTPVGDVHIERWDNRWAVSTCFDSSSGGWDGFTYGDTAPLAICRAALLAVSRDNEPDWEDNLLAASPPKFARISNLEPAVCSRCGRYNCQENEK